MGSYFRSCTVKLAILTFLIFSCAVVGWTPAEDTGKDQEMVNNLKEMKKMLDEQISYWETLVAAAPGENKEKEGSGDEEKEGLLTKKKKCLLTKKKKCLLVKKK